MTVKYFYSSNMVLLPHFIEVQSLAGLLWSKLTKVFSNLQIPGYYIPLISKRSVRYSFLDLVNSFLYGQIKLLYLSLSSLKKKLETTSRVRYYPQQFKQLLIYVSPIVAKKATLECNLVFLLRNSVNSNPDKTFVLLLGVGREYSLSLVCVLQFSPIHFYKYQCPINVLHY